MSGLEPIAALSLACSILQVLEQAMKTTQVAIKVYKDGTLDDLRGHEQDAETLRNLSAEIETVCRSGAPRRPSKFDSDLLKTAAKCRDIQRDIRAHMAFFVEECKQGELVGGCLGVCQGHPSQEARGAAQGVAQD